MTEVESSTHAKEVLVSCNGMKNERKYCDFILKIGEEEIHVHRNILAASSKYFDAMFQSTMKEAETGIAEIRGIEPDAGKQCLEYIYTGKVKFSEENPTNLIHAAEMMQLHGLIDLYFEYLVKIASPDTCLEYMELAVTYNKQSFAKIFENFIGESFGKIVKTDGFKSMTQILLTQCLECLPDDYRNEERQKYDAVKAWINADVENRRGAFPELLSLIDLQRLSMEFLRGLISKEDLVLASDQCQLQVYKALDESRNSVTLPIASQVSSFLTCSLESRLLHQYDLQSKKWNRLVRVPKGTHMDENSGIFSHRGEIYIATAFGITKFADGLWSKVLDTGLKKSEFCQSTSQRDVIHLITRTLHFELNTKRKTSQKCDIPSNLCLGVGFTIVASDKFLYALGGKGTEKRAIEFDLTSRTWDPISSMNDKRQGAGAVFYKGRLMVTGGSILVQSWPHDVYCGTSVEWYKPSVDKWITLPHDGGKNTFNGSKLKIVVSMDKLYILIEKDKAVLELKLDLS